ncbi:MAG: metal ABC transporter ATP-binding protein [Parachlamydiaceae bacterium]
MNKSPIIELDNMTFSYPGHPVLKEVSFQVFPGEFIGIIGPNGGGKTTLLKLMLGFLKPSKGMIKIFGRAAGSASAVHRLAYVPQAVRFDRDFPISVEEVILSGLISRLPWYGKFHASDLDAAEEALDKVGLSHLKKASFGTLSGGQAQRVLIARAIASHPELILLDEPTASVDSQAEADIYTLLNKLKGKMTILMVTHDLGVAIDQVERILCVQGGIMSLKPEEVCKHFAFGLYHKPLIQSQKSQLNL